MAVGVVDGFEMIEVNEQDGKRLVDPLAGMNLLVTCAVVGPCVEYTR